MTENEVYFLIVWMFYLLVGFFSAMAAIFRKGCTPYQLVSLLLLWPLVLLAAGFAALWERFHKKV